MHINVTQSMREMKLTSYAGGRLKMSFQTMASGFEENKTSFKVASWKVAPGT